MKSSYLIIGIDVPPAYKPQRELRCGSQPPLEPTIFAKKKKINKLSYSLMIKMRKARISITIACFFHRSVGSIRAPKERMIVGYREGVLHHNFIMARGNLVCAQCHMLGVPLSNVVPFAIPAGYLFSPLL